MQANQFKLQQYPWLTCVARSGNKSFKNSTGTHDTKEERGEEYDTTAHYSTLVKLLNLAHMKFELREHLGLNSSFGSSSPKSPWTLKKESFWLAYCVCMVLCWVILSGSFPLSYTYILIHYVLLTKVICTCTSDCPLQVQLYTKLMWNARASGSQYIILHSTLCILYNIHVHVAVMYVYYMWPNLRKHSVCDPRVIRTMHVFSSSGPNLSKSRFCHIHVK